MPVTVHIPTPLRGFTAGHDRLELNGATVGEILQALVGEHQGLRRHLLPLGKCLILQHVGVPALLAEVGGKRIPGPHGLEAGVLLQPRLRDN